MSSVHENYKLRNCCVHKLFLFMFLHSQQFMYTTCSELVDFMYWTGKSTNNLLSYYGLVDVGINASDKDLPVNIQIWILNCLHLCYTNRTSIRNLLFGIDFSLLSIQLLGIHRCVLLSCTPYYLSGKEKAEKNYWHQSGNTPENS